MKNNEWIDTMTPLLKKNMAQASEEAYKNGCSLIDDAMILFKANRYARTTALSVLAEEEFSKAFILTICQEQDRWDSTIFKSLTRHSEKQGIAEAMRSYFEWFLNNFKNIMESNRNSAIPAQSAIYPGEAFMEKNLGMARSRFKKPIKDYMKQEGFYVGVTRKAEIKSLPSSISESHAKLTLEEANTFKIITEISVGNYDNVATLFES